METNLREKALFEMLRQAEPELREKYGDDSAVQILDEVLYPIAEKLIQKDALWSERATANTPTVEATQAKTDKERLVQMLATPMEEMVNEDVLQMIANVLGTCIDELDECTTDEERLATLGHALKSMVVLGRWSVLQ
jgi:cation diffusion facilitator CzcD-associated flavoprotein CzcO